MVFKQFNFTVNHKSSGKIESVTMERESGAMPEKKWNGKGFLHVMYF